MLSYTFGLGKVLQSVQEGWLNVYFNQSSQIGHKVMLDQIEEHQFKMNFQSYYK